MTAEDAQQVLRAAVFDENATFMELCTGRDPGEARVHELRLALRVLWRRWKESDALPFDITRAAATILFNRSACGSDLQRPGDRDRSVLDRDLDDLARGAFELLCGTEAETFVVRRPDLGE
jgi:hypothetical protein